MLYIISFQSISCSEASPTSSRPHKGPPEGVSIGHPLNLPPGFPHVAQLCPLAGLSKQFSSRPERRSSPRPPYPQVPQGHSRVAKPSSIIPSPRPPCPQIVQWHPHVPNNHIISLKPTSNRPLTGIRPVLATATLSTSTSEPSRRAEAVIYHSFATAILPTGTPVPSPRAEQSHNLSLTGL